MRPVFHIEVCLAETMCYYWRIVIFLYMVLYCCSACFLLCGLCFACFEVYRLLAFGQLSVNVHQVGFNFNLYKMHGEYNIKHTNRDC
jgi:hypothetical protein